VYEYLTDKFNNEKQKLEKHFDLVFISIESVIVALIEGCRITHIEMPAQRYFFKGCQFGHEANKELFILGDF